jgi:hypothetical protein
MKSRAADPTLISPVDLRDRSHSRTVDLTGVGFRLGCDRIAVKAGARRVARPDEDGVTLAAEAAVEALGPRTAIGALILATTSPPYVEGGSVQTLVEVLGLQGATTAIELGASPRDSLLAVGLAAAFFDRGPVLICASHCGGGDSLEGEGAVALLVEAERASGPSPLAKLTPAASLAVEVRDHWRLPGDPASRKADSSFVADVATRETLDLLLEQVPSPLRAPVAAIGPDRRATARVEKAAGGTGDPLIELTGMLGPVHPLARLVAGLGEEQLVAAVGNGLGEAVHVSGGDRPSAEAERLLQVAGGGETVAAPLVAEPAADYDPFGSGPRSWRDRGADLRLEGLVRADPGEPAAAIRRRPEGTVIACTVDRVFPAAAATGMAAVDLDSGDRFYGQVAIGEQVAIGDRVELALRRLHQGAGINHYFWKVKPCR